MPKDQMKAYVASERGEPSTSKKEDDGSEIQKFIQSKINKILQKMSSTSLVQLGEHFAFTTYSHLTTISESWILDFHLVVLS